MFHRTVVVASTFQFIPHEGKSARVRPQRHDENLRVGGGRKDKPGWTEQKLKTNRDRFNELRSLIQTAATIIYPSHATSPQLSGFNDCNRNFCQKHNLPARSIWEGPGHHEHIALGVRHDPEIERRWKTRLAKRWKAEFGIEMPEKAFLWKPDIEPDKIASYCLKTRKNGIKVKGSWDYITFNPGWETGFRWLEEALRGRNKQKSKPREIQAEMGVGLNLPHYTAPAIAMLMLGSVEGIWFTDRFGECHLCPPTIPYHRHLTQSADGTLDSASSVGVDIASVMMFMTE